MATSTFKVPAISFYWTTDLTNKSSGALSTSQLSIPPCYPLAFTRLQNYDNPTYTYGPYYLLLAPIGGIPTITRVPLSLNTTFNQTLNYSVGTQFYISFFDSIGTSGGAVGPFIVESPANATIINYDCIAGRLPSASPVSMVADSSANPCGEIDVTVAGGVAPYSISIINPTTGLFANSSLSNSKSIKLTQPQGLSAGQAFSLFATDSSGNSSFVTAPLIADSTQGCQSSSQPSNVGVTIGASVGGVIAALLLAIIIYLFVRRRRARKASEELYQETLQVHSPTIQPFFTEKSSNNNNSNSNSHSGSEWGSKGLVRPKINTRNLSSPQLPYSTYNPTNSFSTLLTESPTSSSKAHSNNEDIRNQLASPDEFRMR